MFAPTKVWRRWHRKINVNQRRYAAVSAIAASALPALVMARGHRVSEINEIPCVVDNSVEKIKTTKEAVAALKAIGAYADVERCATTKKIRAGKGKLRNRRTVMRRGPLVVYKTNDGIYEAFRNIPGVDLCPVSALGLLQLAPGGHVGRFTIFSKAAFNSLDGQYGTFNKKSSQRKNYQLPRPVMTNADVVRVINSDEVQSVLKAAKKGSTRAFPNKNPLNNLNALLKLNPYAKTMKRNAILFEQARVAAKASKAK